MEFRTFDSDGNLMYRGDTNLKHVCLDVVPTHGSISLKSDIGWINFKTSEWLCISITDEPKHWGDKE